MRAWTAVKTACLLLLTAATPLHAASLQARPIMVEVPPSTATTTLTLRNDGSAPIAAQIRVFRWSQVGGEEKLEPTGDLVASPPLAKIGAGAEQTIRLVRLSKQPVQHEETYRLWIDELPDASRAKSGQVAIALRYSIPVFFAPATKGAPSLVWSLDRREGKSFLVATNNGDRRVRISEMVAKDQSGSAVSFGKGLNGYVLARSTMRWSVPGNSQKLGLSGPVVISARGDDGPIHAQIAPAPGR